MLINGFQGSFIKELCKLADNILSNTRELM